MAGLTLNIDVRDCQVLVVGGGPVASRKAATLIAAGGDVRLVAPEVSAELQQMERDGVLKIRIGRFEIDDLAGCFLVVAATNDHEVNREVAVEARKRGILVNVADAPELGTCRFPALLCRGDLEVAFSTGGRCPGYAAGIRDLIAGAIGPEYGELLETLATERDKLLTEGRSSTYNSQILRSRIRELLAELATHKDRVP